MSVIMWLFSLCLVIICEDVTTLTTDLQETNIDFLITKSNTSLEWSESYVIAPELMRSRRLISTFDISRLTRLKSRPRVTESTPDALLLREDTIPTTTIGSITPDFDNTMDKVTLSMYPLHHTSYRKYANCTNKKCKERRRKFRNTTPNTTIRSVTTDNRDNIDQVTESINPLLGYRKYANCTNKKCPERRRKLRNNKSQTKRKKRRKKENEDRSVIYRGVTTVSVTTSTYNDLTNESKSISDKSIVNDNETNRAEGMKELENMEPGTGAAFHMVTNTVGSMQGEDRMSERMSTLSDIRKLIEMREISIPGGGSDMRELTSIPEDGSEMGEETSIPRAASKMVEGTSFSGGGSDMSEETSTTPGGGSEIGEKTSFSGGGSELGTKTSVPGGGSEMGEKTSIHRGNEKEDTSIPRGGSEMGETSIPGGVSEMGDLRLDRQDERLSVPGDIMLGGLFSVRSAGCGGVSESGAGAVRAAERAVRGTREVLRGTGVTLGLRIRDDCHNHLRALHHALHFIKGSCRGGAGGAGRVWGVLEGAGDAAVEVASLTRLFKLPQVSFSSSAPELSHKGRFEYFLRTVPSDLHLVRVILHLVTSFNWTYFSVVYQETNFAIKAWEELEWTVGSGGVVCVAARERLPAVVDNTHIDPLLQRLLARPLVRGVVVLGSEEVMRGLWDAAGRAGQTSHFLWMWAPPLSFTNSPITDLSIAESHATDPSLTTTTDPVNTTNPWDPDLPLPSLESHVADSLLSTIKPDLDTEERGEGGTGGVVVLVQRDTRGEDDFRTISQHKSKELSCEHKSSEKCDEPESEMGYHYVTNAVLAFAYAIKSLHEFVCGGRPGVCEEMSRGGGALLLTHLRNVSFIGAGGGQFQFDVWGDGPARYRVWAGRYRASTTRWTHIGRYQHDNLTIDLTKLESVCGGSVAVSVCAAPCGRGQGRLKAAGGDCCWTCYNCTHTQIVSEGMCVSCERGRVPDAGRTRCVPLPELSLDPRAPPAAVALLLATTGLIATGLVSYVWWRHGETAVVRASGREVSAVLLAGIGVSYLVSLLLLLPPTHTLCGLQRFGTGFGFTVMYAALLTKTNRIARIFAASTKSAKRPSLISPRSQLAICALLISVQVVVLGVWELSVRSRAVVHFTPEWALRVCDSFLDWRHVTSFLYPALLVLVCTVYAVITRNIPEAYNESKHIGFTMYTTCVIWLAFVPLYFGTVSHLLLRVTSLSITISLSASVTLICLFIPKVYIVLFRPALNVRSALRPRARNPALLLMAVTLTTTAPEKVAVADKIVQTEDTPVHPEVQEESSQDSPSDDQINNSIDVEFPLDANNLSMRVAGLPNFITNTSSNREGKTNGISLINCIEKL